MKIALCLSGQPRYLAEGYENIYNTLLNKYEMDCFVHTWWDQSMANKEIQLPPNRKYIWKQNTLELIQQYYKPKIFMNETQKIFNTYNDVDYELCKPQAIFSMFYSMMMSNDLRCFFENKNNFKYDLVIRCRFDIIFNKFNLDLNNIDLDKLYLVRIRAEHPNDQFAVGNSKNMSYYCNLYNMLETYYKKGFKKFVGEHLLEHHLKQSNISIYFTDKEMHNDIIKKS